MKQKNEIEKLKEIISEKEYRNERKKAKFYKEKIRKNLLDIYKKMSKKHEKCTTQNNKKIIIFCGNYNSGKSIVLALFTKILFKKSKKNLVINFNEKINDIFSSPNYIYKANVEITLKDKKIVKRIIGRNKNYIITMDNDLISINDIIDIKSLKK